MWDCSANKQKPQAIFTYTLKILFNNFNLCIHFKKKKFNAGFTIKYNTTQLHACTSTNKTKPDTQENCKQT